MSTVKLTSAEKRSATMLARRERQIALGIRGEADPRPVSPIVLFTDFADAGPCEPGRPSALCPHCGSGGRYVWSFVCQDGSKRGAMKGCVKLFVASKLATDQMASIERFRSDEQAFRAGTRKYPPASWDCDIAAITDKLDLGSIGLDEAKAGISAALHRRAAFLARKRRSR